VQRTQSAAAGTPRGDRQVEKTGSDPGSGLASFNRALSAVEAAGYRARPRKAVVPSRKSRYVPSANRARAVDQRAANAARGNDWRFAAKWGFIVGSVAS
jgi:anti-sigma-K factor RskA